MIRAAMLHARYWNKGIHEYIVCTVGFVASPGVWKGGPYAANTLPGEYPELPGIFRRPEGLPFAFTTPMTDIHPLGHAMKSLTLF